MKQKRFLVLVLILAILTTGCGTSQPELTQEENDMIAEYIAGVLLKYDFRYDEKLIYASSTDLSDSQENMEVEPTSMPISSSTSTASSTDVPLNTNASANPSVSPGISNQTGDSSTTTGTIASSPAPTYQSINQLYEKTGCTVSYDGAKKYNSYPPSAEKSYFLLEANANKSLLVLTFEVNNKTKKTQNFSLIESGLSYRLENADGKSSKPLLTALTKDIQYIDLEISAGKSDDAILVFEIPKNTASKDYTLYITNGEITAQVELQ